jgi:hypothetical protein
MSTDRFRATVLCAAVVLLALGGCAAPSSVVRVDKADNADLSKCRTFDWHAASSDATSLTEQRVRAEALKQLQAKGYALATDKPDCRIAYVLNTQDRPKPKPSIGVGAGGGSHGVGGGIGVNLPIGRKQQQSGTFTLDVIDVAQNAQIWSGSVDTAFRTGELSEEEAREAVEVVLAELPDRGESG